MMNHGSGINADRRFHFLGFEVSHDGYKRLPGQPVHSRTLQMTIDGVARCERQPRSAERHVPVSLGPALGRRRENSGRTP
jgi:hypothetical protein